MHKNQSEKLWNYSWTKGGHGEFEPGKAQYIFYPKFFWPVAAYKSISVPNVIFLQAAEFSG